MWGVGACEAGLMPCVPDQSVPERGNSGGTPAPLLEVVFTGLLLRVSLHL